MGRHNQIDNIVIDRRQHSNILDIQLFRATNYDTDHYLLEAKVRKRLAVIKQTAYRVHMKGFALKYLNEVEVREQNLVEIVNRFSCLENISTEVNLLKLRKLLERILKLLPRRS
jgi:hypothetical protein